MSEVKIPEGYKQTEAGLIPSDWKLLTIGDVASFSGGSQPPRSTFIFSPRPSYIRLIQIRDYKTSNFETYIPEHLANKKCEKTDIMIGRYGPPIFQILRGIEGAYNVALIKVTPSNDIQREYLYYFLKTEKLFQLMELLSRRSSGQTGVELPALKAYPIPLPPKSEQTAIATALSDVDNLIGSLEKLIAKKEAIKAGTMQQLLTGKTRLPEFATHDDGSPKGFKQSELGRIPEDWDVSTLGNIAIFLKGAGLPKSDLTDDGQYKCIHYGQLFTLYEELILEVKSLTNVDGNIKSISNDVLMPTSDVTPNGLATASCILENNVVLGGDILIIRANPRILNGVYFAYLINIYREQVMRLVTGSTVYHLYGSTMSKLTISLPNAKEQTAIATILSDLDAEIQALQQRLVKTRDIKQGMMQQLLTGKVRLLD